MRVDVPFRRLPVDQSDVRYLPGPDSLRQPGVPDGRTIEYTFADSAIYPGTARKFWVHLPARYEPTQPAALLVFQDGWWNLDPAGEVRASVVLDNLIHKGDLPPTIGLFVDPGSMPEGAGAGGGPGDGGSGAGGGLKRRQRNIEYDAFDDRYATFLLDEIIPQVTEHFPIPARARRRRAQPESRWGAATGRAALAVAATGPRLSDSSGGLGNVILAELRAPALHSTRDQITPPYVGSATKTPTPWALSTRSTCDEHERGKDHRREERVMRELRIRQAWRRWRLRRQRRKMASTPPRDWPNGGGVYRVPGNDSRNQRPAAYRPIRPWQVRSHRFPTAPQRGGGLDPAKSLPSSKGSPTTPASSTPSLTAPTSRTTGPRTPCAAGRPARPPQPAEAASR